MRLIDADALKRKAQKLSTEAWKQNVSQKVTTILNQFIDWIEGMPTIDVVEVEWIPITTSEPTTSNHVLVTYNWGGDDYDDYEVSELDYWVTKCAAEEGNKQCQMFIDHVIAWAFLPQPYKKNKK